MRTLLCLVVLVGAAAAEVRAPLGPYARPGIPLPLLSDEDITVSIDGWTYALRANEITYVAPMRVPLSVRDLEGNELLRLEVVPEGTLLAAWVGDGPEDLASRIQGTDGRPVVVVRLRPTKIDSARWNVYDLFDRMYALQDDGAHRAWSEAGGSLAYGGPTGDPDGLIAKAGPVRPLRVPRLRASRPDLYQGLLPPDISPEALKAARRVVLTASVAFAVLLLAGALLRVDRRVALATLGLVALAGSVVGHVGTVAAGEPMAVGYIEEIFVLNRGRERQRGYVVVTMLRDGPAPMPLHYGDPVPFRSNPAPWWKEPGVPPTLEAGTTRIFLLREMSDIVLGPAGPFPRRPVTNQPGESRTIGGFRIVLQD